LRYILCFGNSLTAGWTDLGHPAHPYALSLLDGLGNSFPSTDFTADVQGVPGDRVVSPPGYYLPRIDALYNQTEIPYDWAIILGGTNDIATGGNAEDIWQGLKKVYAYPLSHNSKVLALTVPESEGHDDVQRERRDKLNNWILNYKAENFYTFDLFTAFPYWNLTDRRRREIWHDGTHPNQDGYDVWGELFANRLTELISGSEDIAKLDNDQMPFRSQLKARNEKFLRDVKRIAGRASKSGKGMVEVAV